MVASGSDHSAHILSDHIASVRAQQRGHLERLVLTEARLKAMMETIQALPADMLDNVQPEVQKLFAQMEGSLRKREILQREAFSQARRPSALPRATHATTHRPRVSVARRISRRSPSRWRPRLRRCAASGARSSRRCSRPTARPPSARGVLDQVRVRVRVSCP